LALRSAAAEPSQAAEPSREFIIYNL